MGLLYYTRTLFHYNKSTLFKILIIQKEMVNWTNNVSNLNRVCWFFLLPIPIFLFSLVFFLSVNFHCQKSLYISGQMPLSFSQFRHISPSGFWAGLVTWHVIKPLLTRGHLPWRFDRRPPLGSTANMSPPAAESPTEGASGHLRYFWERKRSFFICFF